MATKSTGKANKAFKSSWIYWALCIPNRLLSVFLVAFFYAKRVMFTRKRFFRISFASFEDLEMRNAYKKEQDRFDKRFEKRHGVELD